MNPSEALRQLRSGALALHRLETVVSPDDAAMVRRQFVGQLADVDLDALSPTPFGANVVHGKNIENLIGSVAIPVGVAGPIPVHGSNASGAYYVPLATTEGALVAILNRGCKLLRESGGVTTSLTDHGITRAPLFDAKDLATAQRLKLWVQHHEPEIANAAEATSRHLKWLGAEAMQTGRLVWLRLRFATDEAMGMNMATIAAQAVSNLVCRQSGVKLLALSGNLCVDKKPSYQNVATGRGFSVQAEAHIPAGLIREILQTDRRRLARLATAKNWYGGGLSGSLGANAQSANVVAAVFIATGQDAAHIVDSATCFTICETEGEGLYISVTLPNVLVGSLGGGTGLAQQRTARTLMTTSLEPSPPHGSESRRLAEVLAATVLAGEISLLGALAAGHLATAHRKLGRAEQPPA